MNQDFPCHLQLPPVSTSYHKKSIFIDKQGKSEEEPSSGKKMIHQACILFFPYMGIGKHPQKREVTFSNSFLSMSMTGLQSKILVVFPKKFMDRMLLTGCTSSVQDYLWKNANKQIIKKSLESMNKGKSCVSNIINIYIYIYIQTEV